MISTLHKNKLYKHSCNNEICHLLEAGYSSTVTTSMPFHAATLTPQNRHCSAMIADWLKLRNRKKVQPAEMSIDPPEEITQFYY